jgi:hypothetical protein
MARLVASGETAGLLATPAAHLFENDSCLGVIENPEKRAGRTVTVKGIGGHQRGFEALGPFDLDPCAPVMRPWDMAARHYTVADDGLSKPWEGRVWLNPPYGQETGRWLERLSMHGDGIALIFARTETDMFFRWGWECANAMLFLRGRLHFHRIDGSRAEANAGGPSVLIAYGHGNMRVLERSRIPGRFVQLDNSRFMLKAE